MKLEEAFEIVNEDIYDDFIVEEWDDGELLNDYTVIQSSGLGSAKRGGAGIYCDTWVVSSKGKYYPAKIVKNSIDNKVKVRVYKKDGTEDKAAAFKKCLAYHKELDLLNMPYSKR